MSHNQMCSIAPPTCMLRMQGRQAFARAGSFPDLLAEQALHCVLMQPLLSAVAHRPEACGRCDGAAGTRPGML